MSRTILRKTPDEDVYVRFEDEVELDLDNIVIYGNRDFIDFGNPDLLSIVSGDYYDDEVGYDYETLNQLKKTTGKDWKVRTMRGYSQGDWQEIYYTEEVSEGYLEEIENFYMGKVDEFKVYEDEDEDDYYVVYVPHDIVWKGKNSICRYLDLQPETTSIYVDDGYERVIKYKEIK